MKFCHHKLQRKLLLQETQNAAQAQVDSGIQPPSSISWQQCHDESSGYNYYWNMVNGEVTWDEPEELKQHKAELEKYYQLVGMSIL